MEGGRDRICGQFGHYFSLHSLGETSGNFVISVVANIILLVDALTYQGVVTIVLAEFLYRYFTQKL